MDIDSFTKTRGKPKNVLSGAIDIPIEKAERYGTPLVVKTNGKIEEISPKVMRKRLEK